MRLWLGHDNNKNCRPLSIKTVRERTHAVVHIHTYTQLNVVLCLIGNDGAFYVRIHSFRFIMLDNHLLDCNCDECMA